jgi:hypothetical protein
MVGGRDAWMIRGGRGGDWTVAHAKKLSKRGWSWRGEEKLVMAGRREVGHGGAKRGWSWRGEERLVMAGRPNNPALWDGHRVWIDTKIGNRP